jgi:hypothetical protein
MKKTLLIAVLGAVLMGCGSNTIENKSDRFSVVVDGVNIGYDDKVNDILYSFDDEVMEDDYNSTFESYEIECSSNDGFLVDDVTDTKDELVYITFTCVEK